MNYREERDKQEKIKRRIHRIILLFLVVLIASLCVLTAFYPAASWKYYFSLPKIEKRRDGELRLHFLDTGHGDCTIVEFPDGKTALVDAGSSYSERVDAVMRYLNALKIKKLDSLVLTGGTSGRCGALEELIKYQEIGCVYFPAVEEKSEEFVSFAAEVTREGIPCQTAHRYLSLTEDTALYTAEFLLPYQESGGSGGGALLIEWQGNTALLCGDLLEVDERLLVTDERLGYFNEAGYSLVSIDLLRFPNFGKTSEYTQEFLSYLCPNTVVFSCLQTTTFTPDEWAVSQGTEIYRTDLTGGVIATFSKAGFTMKTL